MMGAAWGHEHISKKKKKKNTQVYTVLHVVLYRPTSEMLLDVYINS